MTDRLFKPAFLIMNFSIRPAEPQDDANLAALLLTCRLHAFRWRDPESFALEDFARETAGEHVWVACDTRGGILGFISIWVPDHFIHHLYVHPSCHRQGVGKALLQTVLASQPTAWRLKCPEVNEAGLAFYNALGWKIVGGGEDVGSNYHLLQSPVPSTPTFNGSSCGD